MPVPELPQLATVTDVQVRSPQPLDDAEQARAAVLITDATAIAYAHVPEISNPPPPTAVGVVCTAVLRALASPPDGNKSERVGEYTRTAAHEGGGLYFREDELALLRPPTPPSRGVFSIWTVSDSAGEA